MRQAGVLAAAGLYALENNEQRLATDHRNAERLAKGLRQIDLAAEQNTNMVFVAVPSQRLPGLCEHLKKSGVPVLSRNPMRLVTHQDVDERGIERALAACGEFFSRVKTN